MKYIVSILLCLTFLMACESENADDLRPQLLDTPLGVIPTTDTTGNPGGSAVTVSFANQIQPLIGNKCATSGCHAPPGGISPTLETYAQIEASKSRVNTRVILGSMPPKEALPQNEKDLIQTWIDEGALNN